jgi:hypothetical protein
LPLERDCPSTRRKARVVVPGISLHTVSLLVHTSEVITAWNSDIVIFGQFGTSGLARSRRSLLTARFHSLEIIILHTSVEIVHARHAVHLSRIGLFFVALPARFLFPFLRTWSDILGVTRRRTRSLAPQLAHCLNILLRCYPICIDTLQTAYLPPASASDKGISLFRTSERSDEIGSCVVAATYWYEQSHTSYIWRG